MTKLIIATLLGWVITVTVASVLVTGTIDLTPTPYAQPGQCVGQVYQTEAHDWQPKPHTPTAILDATVRHDQGKESIRVPMLVGDTITPYEGGE